jgi:hypothetical protein
VNYPNSADRIAAYEEREQRKQRIIDAWDTVRKKLTASLLYDDIYSAIYYADDKGDFCEYGQEIIKRACEAHEKNDVYTLNQLAEIIKLPKHIRDVPILTIKIVELMKLPEDIEINSFGILSLLANNTEAEIAHDVIRRVVYELPDLDRGYSEARKRKTRSRKITNTFEHRLRFERHFLERLLTADGTGINRAKQISKILTLIK